MSIQENIERYAAAVRRVLDHCMCADIGDDGNYIFIYYPHGDWPVDGLRVDRSADGLGRALEVMERHWKESFPAAGHAG